MGVAYRASDQWTFRAGINHADNPVPDRFVNPLFPAIVETHYTGGFTCKIDEKSAFDFGLTIGVTNNVDMPTPQGTMVASHGQFNWQVLYRRSW